MFRLRVRYGRGEEIKFISHLDMIRFWQRAMRRADLPLAYSEGFHPHPRILLALPLALGMTSEAELMDTYLERPVGAATFLGALQRQLPKGAELYQAFPIPPGAPSLQSQVRFADYRVVAQTEMSRSEVAEAIKDLLLLESLPWQHSRDTGERHYDLRKLIVDIQLLDHLAGEAVLAMRVRSDSLGTGRPEQVVRALKLGRPRAIHRTGIVLEGRRD